MTAFLGKSRIRFQLDIGFGDAVTPPPVDSEYPTLLPGLAAPRVRAYRREVSIAEKFEAMVKLGRRNSRMKDFHDLWALSGAFAFDGEALREAVAYCFARRGTPWTAETPDALTSAFQADPDVDARWRAYRRKGHFRPPPPERLGEVCDRIRDFLGPVRESLVAVERFERHWPAGGPWQPGAGPGVGGEGDV
jgi:hypothetical protein